MTLEQLEALKSILPARKSPNLQFVEIAAPDMWTLVDTIEASSARTDAAVAAALEGAMAAGDTVENADRSEWACRGCWAHAVEVYGIRIREIITPTQADALAAHDKRVREAALLDIPVPEIQHCLERMVVTSGADTDKKKSVRLWLSALIDAWSAA